MCMLLDPCWDVSAPRSLLGQEVLQGHCCKVYALLGLCWNVSAGRSLLLEIYSVYCKVSARRYMLVGLCCKVSAGRSLLPLLGACC
jgi:hypothetical protein